MLMASSSSSTSPQLKHDVFLSFRGEDTRDNFTSHLRTALCGKKIYTFIDDQLKRGDQISPALLNAIERSEISIVIFSEGYASSRWCLEELEKILECRRSYGRVVIPVFYRVDPSDVRNQRGAFGNGFAKVNGEPEKLQKWRNALREAANLSGFDSNVIRTESVLIQIIVEEVLKRLNNESTLIDNKKLVGIDSRIEYIESLLYTRFIRKIGIWGIGGIGKTTLAGAVFNKISRHFEGSYFIQNIREESKKSKGLTDLCQQLVSAILEDAHPNLGFAFTRRRIGRTKVLIVFDDVTHVEQIESLIGDLDYLSSESRIIITTRDKHVLNNCKVDSIYEIEALSHDAALQLFSQYAFSQDCPKEDFMQLSSKVLTYVKGVPLALKVLGSFLFKRTKEDWESEINKLERIPHMDIQKVLKTSYDGLNDEEQNIFLDIAFFFKGCNRDFIKVILDACGFNTHIGISVLIDKSLITESFNTITMHDLLQEMGKEIVRQESPNDPSKRSRLWHHDDIYSVLTKNMGTTAIRGIRLHMSEVGEIHLHPKAFSNMYNLKFLQVHSSISEVDNKVHGFEFVESDFSELRYLFWSGYSAKSLPPNFDPKNVVELDMQFSKLEQLLLGGQDLVNLKHINLRNSNNLLRIRDLSQTPNLESLILEGCTSLNESFSSTHNLNKLATLNLKGCLNFNHLLIGIHWKFLRKVILSDCSNLIKVPFIPRSVEKLYLDRTSIKELPSIEHPSKLETLSLENCSRLESLPEDICQLKSLGWLFLSGCSKLDRFPDSLGDLRALWRLSADGIAIREVPSSIVCLNNLKQLHLGGNNFESLPTSIKDLSQLTELILHNCKRLQSLPTSIKDLSSLRFLDLSNCKRLQSLPTSIKDLSSLGLLYISNCKRLQSLPELPTTLQDMIAYGCSSLEAISDLPNLFPSIYRHKKVLNFRNCFKLDYNALSEMKYALQHIEHTADGSSKVKPHPAVPYSLICFPGSEVPGWFNFKSTGSLIHLPVGWLNDNLVSFFLCVVLSPKSRFWVHSSRHPPYDGKNRFWVHSCLSINGVLISDLDLWSFSFDDQLESEYLESDHVFLGYVFNMKIFNKLHTLSSNSEVSIQICIEDCNGKAIKNNMVKKCGVRLLYSKDCLRRDADERMKRGKRKRLKTMNGGYVKSFGVRLLYNKDERMKRGKRKRLKTMNGGYVKSCGGCLLYNKDERMKRGKTPNIS